jgi:DNA-binding winged helix-turn-helix (wHTH) protein
MNRKPLVAMPRVGKPDAPLCCWTCGQPWPSRYDLVIDAVASTVRLDNRQPVALTRNELHVISALVAAFPRWLTRSQVIEHSWDYRPDCDMPSVTSVAKALKSIGELLLGSRYTIESDQQRGVRLTDVDTILREMRLEEAINGALRVKAAARTLQSASQVVAARKAANPKPRHRSAKAKVVEARSAVYARNTKKVRAKRKANLKRRIEAHV